MTRFSISARLPFIGNGFLGYVLLGPEGSFAVAPSRICAIVTTSGWVDTLDGMNEIPFTNVAFSFSFPTDTTLIAVGSGPTYFAQSPTGIVGVSFNGLISGGLSGKIYLYDEQFTSTVHLVEVIVGYPILSLSNPAFVSYDLQSAIGPLDVSASTPSNAYPASFGWFFFSNPTDVTFAATTTPEPQSVALSLLGVCAIAFRHLGTVRHCRKSGDGTHGSALPPWGTTAN